MPRISDKTISQVFQAVRIEDVVGDFVSLRKAGTSYKGLCPFHDERTPSFVVSPSKNMCYCFGCHKGGNAISFLKELNNWTYPEAIRYLAEKYNIEIIEEAGSKEEEEARAHRENFFAINQWANDFFQHNLHETSEGQAIGMAYFRSRGMRDDTIRKFQLGYSPESKYVLTNEANKKHLSPELLAETGLCIKTSNGKLYDRFHDRVMFPVHNVSGKVVAFGGRILKKKENTGKYVNSPESEFYSKRKELYGLFFARQAIHQHDRCYLVEGYTDVISMHQCGIENVVASSGTALTTEQIKLIKRFTRHITVLYDGDNAGIKASLRGIDMLLSQGLDIKVLLLPDGEDPDSFARSNTAEDFVKYIEEHQVDFIRFKTNLLLKDAGDDVSKRSEVINDITNSIALIDNDITRSLYIKQCAELTAIDEKAIADTVKRMRNKHMLEMRQEQAKTTSAPTPSANATQDIASAPQSPTTQQATAPEQHQQIAIAQSEQAKVEYRIMKYIVRYGESIIGNMEGEDGSVYAISFAQYIKMLLDEDGIALSHPLYIEIINYIISNQNTPNFTAISYLPAHPNDAIRQFCTPLTYDRETVLAVDESSITTNLFNNAERLITELNIAIIKDKVNATNRLISNPQTSNDDRNNAVAELMKLKAVELELKKQLQQ